MSPNAHGASRNRPLRRYRPFDDGRCGRQSTSYNLLTNRRMLMVAVTVQDISPQETRFGACVSHPPPWHGSSLAPFVCGGAQRGVSLATGTFTGESRRKPLRGSHFIKLQYINGLRNHDRIALDSFAESRESTLRRPPAPESTLRKPGRSDVWRPFWRRHVAAETAR